MQQNIRIILLEETHKWNGDKSREFRETGPWQGKSGVRTYVASSLQ